MRKVLASRALGAAVCGGIFLGISALPARAQTPQSSQPAQSPSANLYEKDTSKDIPFSSNRPASAAEQRIHERAVIEAQARLARIESRHRQGISMQRPSLYGGSLVHTNPWYPGPWLYYWPCPCE